MFDFKGEDMEKLKFTDALPSPSDPAGSVTVNSSTSAVFEDECEANGRFAQNAKLSCFIPYQHHMHGMTGYTQGNGTRLQNKKVARGTLHPPHDKKLHSQWAS